MRVRVLHVINQLSGRAGAEVSLRDILTSGDWTGITHAVAVLRADTNVIEPFDRAGVRCLVPPRSPGRAGQVRHVLQAIDEFRPNLIHTSLFDADLAGRIAAFIRGIPVVSSLVNTPYRPEVAAVESVDHRKLWAVHRLDRFLARQLTSGFHAISVATADHAVECLGVAPESIRLVPRGRSRAVLGESSERRRETVRGRLGWGMRPVVINVARQEPQKGQQVLVEAFAIVRERHPDALLALVGRSGRSTPGLDSRIAELGLEKSIHRLGVRTDVADLLSAADVFAFPSLYEGLGGAAVEALGSHIPIVASDIPALRELVGDDRGWLVAPGDARALACAILTVLENPGEALRRTRAARERFLMSYELDACASGMRELYVDMERELLGRNHAAWRRPPKVTLRGLTGRGEL